MTTPPRLLTNMTTHPRLLTYQYEDDSNDKGEEVSSKGLVARAPSALGKEVDVREELVLADSLKHLGCAHQAGQGRGQRGCKYTCSEGEGVT